MMRSRIRIMGQVFDNRGKRLNGDPRACARCGGGGWLSWSGQ